MKSLSKEAVARTKDYLANNGRKLDRRLFAFNFEDGSSDTVIEALTAFQNPDGGFGRALEPDIRANASSVIATASGLQILRDIDAPAKNPVVMNAIAYLLDTFDYGSGVWPIVPAEVESAPHAPWWSFEDSEENFGGFKANPRAVVVAHLLYYSPLVPAPFREDVTVDVLEHLATLPDEMGMHDLLAYLTLAETNKLTNGQQKKLLTKLRRAAEVTVVTEPEQWGGYVLKPLDVAPSPDALLAGVVPEEIIERQLDYEIEQQLADGSWPVSWTWDFVNEEAWARAEKDWKGHLAVRKLRVLRAYGRLEL